jgi:hypothetical protein
LGEPTTTPNAPHTPTADGLQEIGVLSQADDLLKQLGMKGSLFGSKAADVLPPKQLDPSQDAGQ